MKGIKSDISFSTIKGCLDDLYEEGKLLKEAVQDFEKLTFEMA